MVRTIYYNIFSVLVMVITTGCAEEPVEKMVSMGNQPNQEFFHSRMIITEDGVTSAILEANHVSVFDDNYYTVIEDSILIEFFNRNGERVSTLTARSGEIWGLYDNVDSLRAEGDVVIISEERNAKMETPFIRWIARTHKIYADSTVRISTEDVIEEGVGFEATDDLKSYTMRNVTGEIQRDDVTIPGR